MASRWRQLWVLVSAVLLMLLVAGCGGRATDVTADGGSGPVTIVHWQHHDDARAKVLAKLKSEFEAANPGITIQTETIPYGDYFNRLLTALAAGQGPDVFQIPLTMAPEMIASGRLAPLPEDIVSVEEVNRDYIPWTVELAQREGKVYGLPTDVQTLVMFINEDLAREAGLDPDRPPTTWEELLDQANKATRRDANGLTQAGLDTRYKWAVYTLLLTQYVDPVVDLEARKVNYDSPQGIEAWTWVKHLMVDAGVDAPAFLTGQTKWEQERAVFYINHPVARRRPAIAEAPFRWRIVLPPRKDASSPLRVPGHSWLYVMNRDTKYPDAAARWIKFLASPEAVKQWAVEAGDLPSLKALVNDPAIVRDETDRLVISTLDYAVPVRQAGGADVDNIRNEIWDNIVINRMPVEEAVRIGAEKENALIKRKLGGQQ